MATKDEFFAQVAFLNSDDGDKYKNLNLNHKPSSLFLSKSTSGPIEKKYETGKYGKNKFCQENYYLAGNDSTIHTLSSQFENIKVFNSNIEARKCINLSDNNTLSLHITAYENSFEVKDVLVTAGIKQWKEVKDISAKITSSFEFPRQQNDISTNPELTQFKASQILLDPNKQNTVSNGKKIFLTVKILNDIFKTSPGTQYGNWRQQILHAVGCPQYISCDKILRHLSAIEKKTAVHIKRLRATSYDTVSVLIGDADEWEKEFQKTKNVAKSDVPETYYDVQKEIEILRQNQKVLELELKKEREEKAEKEKENLQLSAALEDKNERIGELKFRLDVQQKRTYEMITKLDKKEENVSYLSEKVKQKEDEILTLSQNKDVELCELLANMKLKDDVIADLQNDLSKKDEKIGELSESLTTVTKKLEKIRDLNQRKAKKLNSKGVSAKPTTRKRVKEVHAPIEQKRPKYQVMENAKEYSFAFMILCVQLSWLGIFDTKIVEAIRLITTFFNVAVSRIPDRRTIGRWCNDFSLLIDAQLDKFLDGAGDWTLHSDETTLNSDKLQAYIICKVVNGVRQYFVVGMEQVPDKSAARSLKAFIACLKRTIKPFENLDDDTVQDILVERLGKIKNVVGDRASTQKKFNNDLWLLIVSLIPGSPKLNQIFCNHHVLASVWDVFVKSCLNYERIKFDCPSLNFSILQNAIQFVSSSYGERSNKPEKVKELNEWAAKKQYSYVKFPSKLGSRWNVGPAICASLFKNRKIMLEFLKDTNYIVENSHAALVTVLECPAYLVLLQIGAWLDQIINGPWWTEIDSDKHVIELNINSAKIINYLEQVAENPILFKKDDTFPLVTERSPKQIVFRNAVLADVSDPFLEALPIFCQDLIDYLKKQLNSLLEDAVINSEENREMLASASVSNKVSEQVFGMATDQRHLSSSKSIGRIAANVAGTKNHTMEFIKGLSPSEYENLRVKFKSAKTRHRQQKIEERKLLKEEIVEHHEQVQKKQRRKKKNNEQEISYNKFVGQSFTEKWENFEYSGIITKKEGDGYEVYYPNENQYDLYSCDDLKELIADKKIVFTE